MTHRHTVWFMSLRNEDDEILTAADVAEEWNVSVRTIQRYVSQGKIRATRLPGGQVRMTRTAVRAALSHAADDAKAEASA